MLGRGEIMAERGYSPQIIPVDIKDEMVFSYLDYAMSVIIGRALPDVRDGLKPVHRRSLYTMYESKNFYNSPYKKSARIVGDVMGKYHPHGDAAIYDAIVRMAQDFNMRYTLIDGQGNFGSLDGDAPAAMRYTEIRMSRIAGEMLTDIDKDTVDFVPNYDGSLKEPKFLPSKIPNLLINGSSGIAVGMATNIPPHNLREIMDALIAMIENPDISYNELLSIVKGPDFPTGAFIYGMDGIRQAYEIGKGIIKIRANAEIFEDENGEEKIIVSEIPYQVNKARLIEKIAELVKDKKIEGIGELRDESDRSGIRIVIELKRDAIPQIVLNNLFAMTSMEVSFGIIMLAIVNSQPVVLTLKDALNYFILHRKDVVTRRCLFDLKKAEEREHILEGYKIAIDFIDEVISLIRSSKTAEEAKIKLKGKFALSDIQAQAILDLRLQRLTALERQKILEELKSVKGTIVKLKEILADEKLLMKVIVEEFKEIKEKYGDERKTKIVKEVEKISVEDLIPDENMVVTITRNGFIKRNVLTEYRSQRRGGRGKMGMSLREEDIINDLFVASAHSHILFFTNKGKVYKLKVYEIPAGGRHSKGRAIVNLLSLSPEEKIKTHLSVKDFSDNSSLVFTTKKGLIKKTMLSEYKNIHKNGLIAIKLRKDDDLISVKLLDSNRNLLLFSKKGKAIQFDGDCIPPRGRNSMGVIGMRLKEGDEVVGMEVLSEDYKLLTVTEKGFGKRTELSLYRFQKRGGAGVFTIKLTPKTGDVVGVRQIRDDDQLFIITSKGKIIRLKVQEISVIGRVTQGVKLINLEEDERISDFEILVEKEDEE